MKIFNIKAVLFDFDGTLTRPGALNFHDIRKAVGCPPEKPILEYIGDIKNPADRSIAVATLEAFEMRGAEDSAPHSGAEDLVCHIRSLGMKTGILTRNGLAPVRRAFENFTTIGFDDFDVVVTRNDSAKPKPSGEGVRFAAERIGVAPPEMLVVGDYIFDIQAGVRAGCPTVYLKNPGVNQHHKPEADFTISDLKEIYGILRQSRSDS